LALAQDAGGAIWIGAAGQLWRFQSGRFTVFKLPSSLPNLRFWSLLTDPDGSVWVGTMGGGLLRWRDGQLKRCTSADGLPSDTISQLLEDDFGNLWAGSRAGIFSVNRAALNAFFDGKAESIFCRSFGVSDGLPTLECSGGFQPACWRGQDGRLWFATVKGAVSVQPGDLPANRLPPDVVIEGVRVDGVAQAIDRQTHALTLSPGRHYVEFRFTGISLTAPESVRFQWRLAGLASKWVDGGGQRSVSYSFLPPGDYRFDVRACNSDGVWNETGASLNLTVRPHFWETGWFKFGSGAGGLMCFLGAGLLIQRRRYRTRMLAIERQHALERERTRIARDIHDQVGANLTKIGIQTDQLGRQPGMPAEAQPLVQGVAETTREMLQSMDEIVWAINPRNDTLKRAVNYLIHYTRDFLRPAGIAYHLDLPVDLPVLPLSTQVRHNLFMAFKEALNNAVKHGRPRSIRLVLALQPHELKLAVEDDGAGFTPTPSRDGADGLDNMRQRLKSLGGQCLIESAPGRGTRVTFQLPRQIPGGPDTHLHVY
jgi:signal transduction histidine kinase